MLDSYSDIKTSLITNREIPRNQMYKKIKNIFSKYAYMIYHVILNSLYFFLFHSLQDGDDNEFEILKMSDDLYKIRVKKVTVENKKRYCVVSDEDVAIGKKIFSFWILYSRGDVCIFFTKVWIEWI